MEKKFIESKGIQLAYVEQNPLARNSIIFIHGNSGSSRLWEKQFNDELFSGYHLIAFDLPAHGQSSSSYNPENDYSVVGLANIISSAVINLVLMGPYIIVGFSLGTNVVVEMLAFSLTPQGIILVGADLIGGKYTIQDAINPGADVSVLFVDDAPIENVTKYIALASSSKSESDIQMITSDYYLVKTPFRSTLLKTVLSGVFSDEISLLKNSNILTLFVYGANENLLNSDYLKGADLPVWKDTIYKIPGAGHFLNIDQPEKLDYLISQYTQEIFKENHP
jgi:pimeloyl-ACP methyl ester carboxylesterase